MTSSEIQVRGTNDYSVVSKASMCQQGYYDDKFIGIFASKRARRTPLINRGYYIRARAMASVLDTYIEQLAAIKVTHNVVSLGAGFDSTYFRLRNAGLIPADGLCQFYEIDYSETVTRKRDIIRNDEMLSTLTGDETPGENVGSRHHRYGNYHLVGCDLTDFALLEDILSSSAIDWMAPTLIISECVLSYMDPHTSDCLLQWCCTQFSDSILAVYEQVAPEDGFSQFMLRHFVKQGSPLRGLGAYSTVRDQANRYTSLGWTSCHVTDMNTFYDTLSRTERGRVESLELFDEFEEWHLKCAHYTMSTCCNAHPGSTLWRIYESISQTFPDCSVGKQSDSVGTTVTQSVITEVTGIRRYGHASAKIGAVCQNCDSQSGVVLVIGGLVNQAANGRHCRSDDVITWCVDCLLVNSSLPVGGAIGNRVYHTATTIGRLGVLIFGGRTSPAKPCQTTLILTVQSQQEGSFTWQPVPPSLTQPEPRWRHSANSLTINGTEYVVIFGGRTCSEVLDDCCAFNADTMTWVDKWKPPASTPAARHTHSASVWGQSLVVSGGLDPELHALGSIHVLDVQTCLQQGCVVWTELNTTPSFKPRYSHTSHVINDKLITVGGVTPSACPTHFVTVVDLQHGTVTDINTQTFDPCWPIMLHNHTSVGRDDGTIIVIGGGGNCFSFGTHFNQSPIRIHLSVTLSGKVSSDAAH